MARMDLIAGDAQDVLVVVGTGEEDPFADASRRFSAHLPLGGGVDPTWLDLFAEAVRAALDSDTPIDFIDARIEIAPSEDEAAVIIERIDPGWISDVARIPDASIDAVAGRWIDRLEEELGVMAREEKPWIRDLAGRVVMFCRSADRAPDVVVVWALR